MRDLNFGNARGPLNRPIPRLFHFCQNWLPLVVISALSKHPIKVAFVENLPQGDSHKALFQKTSDGELKITSERPQRLAQSALPKNVRRLCSLTEFQQLTSSHKALFQKTSDGRRKSPKNPLPNSHKALFQKTSDGGAIRPCREIPRSHKALFQKTSDGAVLGATRDGHRLAQSALPKNVRRLVARFFRAHRSPRTKRSSKKRQTGRCLEQLGTDTASHKALFQKTSDGPAESSAICTSVSRTKRSSKKRQTGPTARCVRGQKTSHKALFQKTSDGVLMILRKPPSASRTKRSSKKRQTAEADTTTEAGWKLAQSALPKNVRRW